MNVVYMPALCMLCVCVCCVCVCVCVRALCVRVHGYADAGMHLPGAMKEVEVKCTPLSA